MTRVGAGGVDPHARRRRGGGAARRPAARPVVRRDHADARRGSRARRRVPAVGAHHPIRRRHRRDRALPPSRSDASAHHVVDVYLRRRRGGARARRCSSSGGRSSPTARAAICGRATIDELAADIAPLAAARTVARGRRSASCPARLRARQATFDETGGLHGAALFAPTARCSRPPKTSAATTPSTRSIGSLLLSDDRHDRRIAGACSWSAGGCRSRSSRRPGSAGSRSSPRSRRRRAWRSSWRRRPASRCSGSCANQPQHLHAHGPDRGCVTALPTPRRLHQPSLLSMSVAAAIRVTLNYLIHHAFLVAPALRLQLAGA